MAREKGMGNLQREKSGRWTMRVGINGKRYCRSTRTKDREQAERILQRFLAPLGLGTNRLPMSEVWFEYVRSPRRNDLAQSTLNAKRAIWMHFARWMEEHYLPIKDLSGVTSDMICEYLACIRVDICASTYNSRVCVLREIFHVVADKASLDEDVWFGIKLHPEDFHSRRELTKHELVNLLSAAKKHGVEWHSLFLIGIYTGLRLGDCCKLDWSNINIAEGIIQIVPHKTKRHHERLVTIPIHQALGKALFETSMANENCKSDIHCSDDESDAACASSRPFVGPVLPTICNLYAKSHWKIGDTLSAIFKAAGITTSVKLEGRKHRTPEATFHSLRHTFVSMAANAGIPLHVVQSIVGHESTTMTRHYYHESLMALKSAVNAIPAFC